ncbi:Rieske 2Fe-2S domain-containing protein [Streptomyces polyrhachis]|uniref:Rieske 2Fe-2S domain-containing protein n=1 Tax=Streptomyces polyrhachis TaxID=1282885 RepID=A0ABW2GFK9_9ACTN
MPKMIESAIERIADADALDRLCHLAAGRVHKVTARTAVKNALSGTWLGHPVHPIATTLPIGAWAMACALDATAGRSGAPAARRLVGLGVLAALPAAATGASDWSDTIGATQRVGLVHAWGNLTATALQAASWLVRRRGCRRSGIALSAAALGSAACAAYLGGHLSLVRGIGVNHTAFQEPVTDWTDVAALSDLTEGKPTRVTPGGVPVVLVRYQGTVYALSATCTHEGGPLDKGEIVGDGCIKCPWHGSEFRLTDGQPVRGPASVTEPSWEVKLTDDRVAVRSTPS